MGFQPSFQIGLADPEMNALNTAHFRNYRIALLYSDERMARIKKAQHVVKQTYR